MTQRPQPSEPSPPSQAAPGKLAVAKTPLPLAPRLPETSPLRGSKSRKRGCLATLGAMILLLGAVGVTTVGGWISLQLIINPDTAIWLNRYLPAWTRLPVPGGESLKTLSEVRSHVEQAGLVGGEFLALSNQPEPKSANPDLLFPVLNQAGHIIELRVYRPAPVTFRNAKNEPYFWLVSQIEIAGPEESFVIAPLVNAQSAHQGSSRALPLTTLERFQEKTPNTGIWLNLRGEWAQSDLRVPYGYILHYNPTRNYLSVMLSWTSPGARGLQWQELTGGGMPELVVDQTVGLEPQMKVYQVKPRKFLPNPIQLEAVSLSATSLKSNAYENALILARSGLWSPSLQWLQSLKRRNPLIAKRWSAAVQAQLSVVELHAKLTKAQAEKTWASPSEQVLAYLIDGRWKRALQTFQSAGDDTSEIATMLKTDSGRLWRRVTAALKVSSNQPDVKAWGALIVSAKQGRGRAIAWLKQQGKNSSATNTKIYQLLNQLDRSLPNDEGLTSYRVSQIIGSAKPLGGVNAASWFPPDPQERLKLEPGQRWYAVTVSSFYDGKTWRQTPFRMDVSPATVGQIWNLLGLNGDAGLQILVWTGENEQTPVAATVKALQVQAGELRLLAAGDPLPASPRRALQPLVLSTNALQWLEPSSMTLAELYQQNPTLVSTLVQNLWRELQSTQQVRVGLPSLDTLLQPEALGEWQVQQVDLTGNNQVETLLTFDPTGLNSLQSNAPQTSKSGQARTMIFSEAGSIIYSEFNRHAGQSMIAIADLTDGGPPALIVNTASTYQIERWSTRKKRFE